MRKYQNQIFDFCHMSRKTLVWLSVKKDDWSHFSLIFRVISVVTVCCMPQYPTQTNHILESHLAAMHLASLSSIWMLLHVSAMVCVWPYTQLMASAKGIRTLGKLVSHKCMGSFSIFHFLQPANLRTMQRAHAMGTWPQYADVCWPVPAAGC